ncbi:MAG: hypothetical protein ABIJ27_08265 [Candidatus Omnitrophota bacterium]
MAIAIPVWIRREGKKILVGVIIGILVAIIIKLLFPAKDTPETRGDYSPGVVKGDYTAGDSFSGDKVVGDKTRLTRRSM